MLFSNIRVLAAFEYSTTTNAWTAVAGKRFRIASLLSPRGLVWNPGTSRLHVADRDVPQVLAYQNDGTRDDAKDIDYASIGSIDPAFTIGGLALVPVTGGNNRLLMLNTNLNSVAVHGFDAVTGTPDADYNIRHDTILSVSAEFQALGITYDGTNVLLTDQLADSAHAFTYTTMVAAVRKPDKDVAASVLESANASIDPTGLVWDGTHYRVADANANKVYKFTKTAHVAADDISFGERTNPAPQGLGIDDDGRIYILIANRDVLVYDADGTYSRQRLRASDVEAVAPTLDPKGVAWINGTVYLLDGTEDTAYAWDKSGANYSYNATRDDKRRCDASSEAWYQSDRHREHVSCAWC